MLRGALGVAIWLAASPLVAQPQVRFGAPVSPVGPIMPAQATVPTYGSQLGQPAPFDPYGAGGGYVPPANTAPALPPGYPQTQPIYTAPPVQPYGAPVQPQPLGGPAYPPGGPAYPAGGPPAMFPNGINMGGPYGAPAIPGWQTAQPYLKLFNRFYFQYTWLEGGNGPYEMDINDLDINVTAAFPNFLFSCDPLYVTPGFTQHLWAGPTGLPSSPPPVVGPPFGTGQHVPPRAYSAYLGFGWQPRLATYRQFGADLSVVAGVYSDFNAFNSDSFRLQGSALLVLQLTPAWAVKGGIVYLDRVKTKMLPAGGVVWTPNERTEFSILFPNPKLRKYWTTWGQTDVWWYVSGEYGGGSWSIEHVDLAGTDDRMDINDIRVGGGLEFVRPGGAIMWIEGGYVFERELVFATPPPPAGGFTSFGEYDLKDTFMIRAGISF